MIQLCQGDILSADAEALVNTVNCVGIMGRGIALQFRNAFPENYAVYKTLCDKKQLHPGKMLVFDLNRLENPRFIINFPTKRHWKGNSRIEDIQSGLKALVEEVKTRGIRSIAVPPLGCGLGGLNWREVRPLIEDAFKELPSVRTLIYEPAGAPPAKEMVRQKASPKLTVARAALIGLMRRYLAAVMDPFVSLLEIHKLMYFMQEAGEPLKLKVSKGRYGPYAENLRHVLIQLEGHYISGYGDAEDNPDKQIELKPGAADKAEELLSGSVQTRERFERVANLIEGFETPFGMELLSTVHWVARKESAQGPDEAIKKTYAWNSRKRMFTEEQIRIAWRVLHEKHWLN
jgi:O-acetyl-ADP-ribose deacetylase (regulator of RNase III)